MKKTLYKGFDLYSQSWYFVYAYSIAQAEVFIRNQILKRNGKYNIVKIMKG